jgi:hypothetical protein
MNRPARPPSAAPDDPYRALVAAIISRAVHDARGQCASPGGTGVAQLQAEAQDWLADEAAVAGLLELGGYDAGPLLARLRKCKCPTPSQRR